MAGLMTDVYTYDALANKYGNFHIPAIRLYINGSELNQEMSQNIIDVEISLSLSAANTAVIRIDGNYDREKRSFDSKIVKKFKLGTIIEVGIGYGSEVKKVLKGFVALLSVEFGQQPCLVVTIMDARRLMMCSGVHQVLHDVKNYSDAVKKILANYSKLCKAEIDATKDNLQAPISQNSTDYDFIANELASSGRVGREFFVLADTAYFRKPRKEKRPMMKMEFGRELQNFQIENGYLDLKIEVSGYNQQEQKPISAIAVAKTKEPQSSLFSQTPVSCISDAGADTQERAKTRAQSLADNMLTSSQNGRGTCIGLPEIVPGRYLEVAKLEEMVNKKYYVTSVRHSLNQNFFQTEFEIGGWI